MYKISQDQNLFLSCNLNLISFNCLGVFVLHKDNLNHYSGPHPLNSDPRWSSPVEAPESETLFIEVTTSHGGGHMMSRDPLKISPYHHMTSHDPLSYHMTSGDSLVLWNDHSTSHSPLTMSSDHKTSHDPPMMSHEQLQHTFTSHVAGMSADVSTRPSPSMDMGLGNNDPLPTVTPTLTIKTSTASIPTAVSVRPKTSVTATLPGESMQHGTSVTTTHPVLAPTSVPEPHSPATQSVSPAILPHKSGLILQPSPTLPPISTPVPSNGGGGGGGGIVSVRLVLYIVPPVGGVLLCVVLVAFVLCCRRYRRWVQTSLLMSTTLHPHNFLSTQHWTPIMPISN